MKLLFSLFFLFSTSYLWASEKAFYFQEILNRYQSADLIDVTTYNNNLIYGRCFTNNSQVPTNAAILIRTTSVDSGPIGNPADLVSHGAFLEDTDVKYDSLTYADALMRFPEAKNFFTEFSANASATRFYTQNGIMELRIGRDGYVYGTISSSYPESLHTACYFFGIN